MKFIGFLLTTLLVLILSYFLLVIILGLLPVNKDYQPPKDGIEIFVFTNGKHTFLCLPVQHPSMDWRKIFSPEEFPPALSGYTYLNFGWGDRAYYTEAESWDDLNLKLALQAALIPSASAMHIEYLSAMPVAGEHTIPLMLTDAQYRLLINYMYASVQTNEDGKALVIPGVSRFATDRFYEAHGKYHMINTSNNWTNRALKKMGIRSPIWSPLENPIMWHLEKVRKK